MNREDLVICHPKACHVNSGVNSADMHLVELCVNSEEKGLEYPCKDAAEASFEKSPTKTLGLAHLPLTLEWEESHKCPVWSGKPFSVRNLQFREHMILEYLFIFD